MSDDLVERLRAQATVLAEDHPAVPTWVLDSLSEAADHIAKVEAERDEFQRLCGMHDPTGADHMEDAARLAVENDDLRAERDALREALTEWGHYPTCERWRWLVRAPMDSGRAPSCNCPLSAVPLDPEDGGESSVWLSAQPMSPTMRQAVAEAKQRPPARHFEPSTLLEDGERDE